MKQCNDISSELILSPHKNGVILLRPNLESISSSVASAMTLPFNVYFCDKQHRCVKSNLSNALAAGFDDAEKVKGLSIENISTPEHANLIINSNTTVMKNQREIFVEENFYVSKIDQLHITFSIKLPWYHEDGSLQGILGFSLSDGSPSTLGVLFNVLHNFGIIRRPIPVPFDKNVFGFTSREKEVLTKLIHGLTIKKIALTLGCSPRTIEHHIENAKRRANAHSKSELIEKIIDNFIN